MCQASWPRAGDRPASLISPFTSSQIVRALIAGCFVFGDVAVVWTLLGRTAIVASGLLVFHREAAPGKTVSRMTLAGDGHGWT